MKFETRGEARASHAGKREMHGSSARVVPDPHRPPIGLNLVGLVARGETLLRTTRKVD